MIEFKKIPIDSKLKQGDVFLFIATNIAEGEKFEPKSWGSALITDFHQSDGCYNVLILDYKGVDRAGAGKGAILDIKEGTRFQIANENGVSRYRGFAILGGNPDENLASFVEDVKRDLGEGALERPLFLLAAELKESNILEEMSKGNKKFTVDSKTGRTIID